MDDEVVDQTWSQRLITKGQKSPFLIASFVTLIGICGYGAYSFKNRKISTQMYLIQLRVTAQGAAIACLTLGMAYRMIQEYVLEKKNES